MNSSIGATLETARTHLGLTVQQVSEFLAIDEASLLRYESGDLKLTVHIINQLSALYGVDYLDLTEGRINAVISPYPTGLVTEDLQAIADINRIALNIREIEQIIDR